MPKWVIAKRVIATISIIFVFIITFQSCIVGIGNAISSSGETSGTAGLMVAFGFLISGIIMIFSAKANSKIPQLISAALLWLNYFIAKMMSGSYTDLVIWGFISFSFGVFYLFSAVNTKIGYIIVSVISLIYLIIAVI